MLWDGYNLNNKGKAAKLMLKVFKEAVELGKRLHQGSTAEEAENSDNDDDDAAQAAKAAKAVKTRKVQGLWDVVVPITVPVGKQIDDSSLQQTKEIDLGFNWREAPTSAAGRFVTEHRLDNSLLARVAEHVHVLQQEHFGESNPDALC